MRAEILVTGGSGLLGHALRQVLPQAVFIDSGACDLRDQEATRRLFARYQPRNVLHLAAKVGGVKHNAERNAEMFRDNVLINAHVLAAAQEQRVERLISMLSTCALAESDRPVNENDLHEGMPYAGNFGYGYAKRMLDVHTKILAREAGLKFSTLLPVTMYGPQDNFDPESGHVISALICKSLLAKQEGKDLSVWGSGRAMRQFVYAGDVARLLAMELKRFEGPETMIVAPDQGLSIQALARCIAEATGFLGNIVFDAGKPEGQRVKIAQSLYFDARYPGFSFTPLPEGLRRTVAWYQERRQTAGAR